MLRESIARKTDVVLSHQTVARDFGDYRCGRDTKAPAVTLNQRGLRQFECFHPSTIDQHMIRFHRKSTDSAHHRANRCMIDVQAIDFGDRCRTDTDGDGSRTDDRGEPVALGHREGLRIANAGDPMAARPHDDRGRDNRATGGGDADLIDTDDAGEAIAPQGALEAERRDDDRHRATA